MADTDVAGFTKEIAGMPIVAVVATVATGTATVIVEIPIEVAASTVAPAN
jgi:hypothetical protein